MASQLLNAHSYGGHFMPAPSREAAVPTPDAPQIGAFTLAGVAVTASFAFATAWLIHWMKGGAFSTAGKGRMMGFLIIISALAIISYAYMRRQWLQYLRQQTLSEISGFVAKSHDFDLATSGALSLIQEVELVSRGYRM